MTTNNKINIFWFRRDLRLEDNTGLHHALKAGLPVQCVFIFDRNILDELEDKHDRRLVFVHQQLEKINLQLKEYNATLLTFYGTPLETWKKISTAFSIQTIFCNHDYEPYANDRDKLITDFVKTKNVSFQTFKDQVVFEKTEVVKDDGKPYTIFTPYKNKWRSLLNDNFLKSYTDQKQFSNFHQTPFQKIHSLKRLGFDDFDFPFFSSFTDNSIIKHYSETRDIPSLQGTSRLSIHLRFGTISIRKLVKQALKQNDVFLNELIWREFYMMVLWHFPHVVNQSFKKNYDRIRWRNDEQEFERWCNGTTGYPIVDAGMRELNATGFMHNRARMITASFLTKHLLTDWRWGEAYFAKKLLDFELSSTNGGWQWSAGTGCDAAPYFRIFNPTEQTKKFDPEFHYIRKWVPEFEDFNYPKPIVDHAFARKRCLDAYKKIRG